MSRRPWLELSLMGCALTSCVQKLKTEPKTLIIGVESEIKNLDFRSAVDANTQHIMNLFAQGLVKIDEHLMPVPDLALSFTTKDAKTYTFELPRDARFHDGRPVTCEDVKACFDQAAQADSRVKSSLADVASTVCAAPNVFVITLKAPRATFIDAEVPVIKIMPKDLIFSAKVIKKVVGSGPYRFVERSGRDLIFERFADYRQPLFFDKVIIRVIEDPTTRFLSLMGGDIDILFNAISPVRVDEASRSKFLRVYKTPGIGYQYLAFNLRLAKFKDQRVRRALAIAIDRADIIAHKFLGFAAPATSALPPLNPYFNARLKPLAYDPDEAKKLLKAAGAEGLTIDLKSSSDRDVLSVLLIIKEEWERLGVTVNLKPYEFGTFFSDVQKGNFEMYALRWTGVTSPDLLNKIFHSRELPPGRNRIFYANPRLDQLLDAAAHESDFKRRRQEYRDAQEIIYADMPYIPLWYPDNIVVASSQLRDFTPYPNGDWAAALKARKEAP